MLQVLHSPEGQLACVLVDHGVLLDALHGHAAADDLICVGRQRRKVLIGNRRQAAI